MGRATVKKLFHFKLHSALTNNKNHMKKLELEHFDIGIAEVWDWYAFYIFEMLGIPTTVATSAMPSQAQFYAWMDNYEQKLIKANIPGN
jgi:hypothetical protein